MERKTQARGFDWEEFLNPKGKLSSPSTFLHVIWLKRWWILLAWVLLGLPTALYLACQDFPKTYEAAAYLRFPRVEGGSRNSPLMRDASLDEAETVVRLFASQQVFSKTMDKMGLRLRITTPGVFRQHVVREQQVSERTPSGRYRFQFPGGNRVQVSYRAWSARTYRPIYSGPLGEGGAANFAGSTVWFQPSFLGISRGLVLDMMCLDPNEALTDFTNRFKVTPLDKGQMAVNYEARLTDNDPFLVADVVNDLTRNFLAVYSGTTEVQDKGVLERMQKGVNAARANVERAQARLSQFYERNQDRMMVRGNGNEFELSIAQGRKAEVETGLERLVQSLSVKPGPGSGPDERRLWMGEMLALLSGQGVPRAEALRSKIADMERKREQLAAAHSPTHPFIKEADAELDALYDPVVTLAESAQRNMRTRLSRAVGEIDRNRPTGATDLALQLESQQLIGDRDKAVQAADVLQLEYDRARLSAQPDLFRINVIDTARAPLYVAPNFRSRLIMAGAGGGLALFPGLIWILLAQILFPRIWNKDDAERKLKVKVLGSLFHMEGGAGINGTPDEHLLHHGHHAKHVDVEAYRSLRVEIENKFDPASAAGTRREALSLLITSTHPGEGKSLVSANLAISFARRGRSTLLVDADFRHGSQERIFGRRAGEGLADLLRLRADGDKDFWARAQSLLISTPQTGLILMPKGRYDDGIPEASYRSPMEHFLRAAAVTFDVVIVDCAPVIVTADPLNLVRLMKGVVFIVRSGQVSAREASRALEPLADRGAPLGVVINGINPSPADENYFAKYGYYYTVHQARPDPTGTQVGMA